MRKIVIHYLTVSLYFYSSEKLVTLFTVTNPMRKLKIIHVTRVTTFCYWNDMVYTWRHRVRILLGEVNRLATYTAYCLCSKYLFLINKKLPSMTSIILIRSVSSTHDVSFCSFLVL